MKIFNVKLLIFALVISVVSGMGSGTASAQGATNSTNTTITETKSTKSDTDAYIENMFTKVGEGQAETERKRIEAELERIKGIYDTSIQNLEKSRSLALGELKKGGATIGKKFKDEKAASMSYATAGAEDYGQQATFFDYDIKMPTSKPNNIDFPEGKDWQEVLQNWQNSLNEINNSMAAWYAEYVNKRSMLQDQLAAVEMAGNGDLYKYADPKTGAVTYFEKRGDAFVSIAGASKGCTALPAKLGEAKSCLFCPLFTIIFNTAQQMATKSFSDLSMPMAQVMLLGFAIWIAIKVLLQVSSFTKQDGPKFITELLVQGFKVMVAFILLAGSSGIFMYVIGPVLNAGLEFGTAMLFDIPEGTVENFGECGITGDEASEPGVLPTYLHGKLICFIKAVQQEIAQAHAISTTLMCVGTKAASDGWGLLNWDYSMIFQGLLIFIFAWLIMLAFAFYLIDATVRLGIFGALIPFLIACWPFNVTRKYTTTGWTMFMNTFFTYVFMGLVITVNVKLMMQALTGGKGGIEAIQDAINGDNVETLKEILDIGFAGFLILIGCCIFGFKLSAQAGELAGTMAGGGGGTPIGARIGGMAASAATTLGKHFAKTGKKLAWDNETSRRIRSKAWNGTKKGLGKGARFVGKVTGITAGAKAVNKARKTAGRAIKNGVIKGAMNIDNARRTAGRNIKNSVKQGWEDIKNNEGPAYNSGMTPTGMIPISPNDKTPPPNDREQTPPPNDRTPPPNDRTPPSDDKTPPAGDQTPNEQKPNEKGDTKGIDEIKAEIASIKSQIDELKGTRGNPVKGKDIVDNMKKVHALEQRLRELEAQLKSSSDPKDEKKDTGSPDEVEKNDRKPNPNKEGDKGGGDVPAAKTYDQMNNEEKATFEAKARQEFRESGEATEDANIAVDARAQAASYRGDARNYDIEAGKHMTEYQKRNEEFERRDALSPENGGFKDAREREFEQGRVSDSKANADEASNKAESLRAQAKEQDAIAENAIQNIKNAENAHVQDKINELNNVSPDKNAVPKENVEKGEKAKEDPDKNIEPKEKNEKEEKAKEDLEAQNRVKEVEAKLLETENKLKETEAKLAEAEKQLAEAKAQANKEEKEPDTGYMKATKYKEKYEEAQAKVNKLKQNKENLEYEKARLANQRDEAGARAAEAIIKAGEAAKDLSREQNKSGTDAQAKAPEVKTVTETKIETREVSGSGSTGSSRGGSGSSSRTGGSSPSSGGSKPDQK